MGSTNTFYWGLVLILFGILFLLDNFDIMDFSYFISTFWPVILILIGLKIILNKKRNEFKIAEANDNHDKTLKKSNSISESNIFGDITIKASEKNFSGGTVNNVFGNIRLDLSDIQPIHNLSQVFISGVFGDITIITSKDIPVKVKANAIAGDIKIRDNSREGIFPNLEFIEDNYDRAEKKIYIQLSIVFGSINVH